METFEIHDLLQDERDVLCAVEQLAVELDAEAPLVSGLGQSQRVAGMADRARLLIRHVR